MNSLDAPAAAEKGVGIVRVPSRQAKVDLAAGHHVRLLADDEPAPVPLHLMFQPSRLASPKIRAFVERWRDVDPLGAHPRVDR